MRPLSFSFLIALVFFLGCTLTNKSNVLETDRYAVTVDSIEGCTLIPSAYEENGRLKITGRMTLRHHKDWPLSGDVTAEVVSPSGEVIESKKVPFTAHPHGRHRHPSASFELYLSSIPPEGSEIRLRHTLKPFDGKDGHRFIR